MLHFPLFFLFFSFFLFFNFFRRCGVHGPPRRTFPSPALYKQLLNFPSQRSPKKTKWPSWGAAGTKWSIAVARWRPHEVASSTPTPREEKSRGQGGDPGVFRSRPPPFPPGKGAGRRPFCVSILPKMPIYFFTLKGASISSRPVGPHHQFIQEMYLSF